MSVHHSDEQLLVLQVAKKIQFMLSIECALKRMSVAQLNGLLELSTEAFMLSKNVDDYTDLPDSSKSTVRFILRELGTVTRLQAYEVLVSLKATNLYDLMKIFDKEGGRGVITNKPSEDDYDKLKRIRDE